MLLLRLRWFGLAAMFGFIPACSADNGGLLIDPATAMGDFLADGHEWPVKGNFLVGKREDGRFGLEFIQVEAVPTEDEWGLLHNLQVRLVLPEETDADETLTVLTGSLGYGRRELSLSRDVTAADLILDDGQITLQATFGDFAGYDAYDGTDTATLSLTGDVPSCGDRVTTWTSLLHACVEPIRSSK